MPLHPLPNRWTRVERPLASGLLYPAQGGTDYTEGTAAPVPRLFGKELPHVCLPSDTSVTGHRLVPSLSRRLMTDTRLSPTRRVVEKLADPPYSKGALIAEKVLVRQQGALAAAARDARSLHGYGARSSGPTGQPRASLAADPPNTVRHGPTARGRVSARRPTLGMCETQKSRCARQQTRPG